MDGSIILFEPYPFEERRGEWGRWRMGCGKCAAFSVARYCFDCRSYLCVACMGPQDDHREWLASLACERLLGLV
jgi:hypothetical protein